MTIDAVVEVTFSTLTLASNGIADCSRMEFRIAGSIGESKCGVDSVGGIFFGVLGGSTAAGKAELAPPALVFELFGSGGGDSENDCESES